MDKQRLVYGAASGIAALALSLTPALAADASMLCYAYDATNWECLTLAR